MTHEMEYNYMHHTVQPDLLDEINAFLLFINYKNEQFRTILDS